MISSCVTRCFGRGKCLPGPATASIYQTIRCISTNSNKAAEAPIFPKLEDVKMHELIGNNNFGKKTYYVERSRTGNLPVYSAYKNGGNKTITEIRKIEGDVIQLRNDLQEQLPFIPKKSWSVVMQSKKIIIKGNAVEAVKRVLTKKF
ncbi:CDN_1a_G0006210.mRNA.1.CDS.1 [Saccharomyces cerevisiae]|nr:Img2p [Saccharomyces cerevisiae YJM1399]CAI4293918.1 CPI_1c_G0006060.mRNA.1.CDS.1 [Saccharomyces cerevisiae]CAI4300235.1 BBM_1a_G0006040.mRNA.1.CDS.1 [Saccharomyces cerevisiae]CAI4301544.1 CPA_1a_G0006130.mRNA.1.CDS.1 [Saccharomyces cerevisiae]CAI4302124.1 ADE_G0006010.mRNA.1.CDS.1 [Saccharomyces cerevisiae]